MNEVHLCKENKTIETLLARIKGENVRRRKNDADPIFDQTVPEPNRELILGFYKALVTEDLSRGRIAVLLGNIYRVSCWLQHRPFQEMTKDDIIDLIEQIKSIKTIRYAKKTIRKGYAEQTIESYKITIKKFWKWLKGTEECPSEVSWIKRKKKKNGLLPEDIWTPDEINKLAGAASNTRDRAFILGLFGSGCRIGEWLPLRRKDIMPDKYSCYVLVNGKTGSRRVRLTPAASLALAAWLDVHPNKDSEAPIWINIQVRKEIPDQHLTYDWAHKMLKDLAKRAGISKPIRPHLMRHSLASFYAPRLTESVMNEHFGWRQGGRTVAIYTHLSGKQVDDQILAVFGKKKIDPQTNEAIDIVYCKRCGLENTPGSQQCSKCGYPLSDKVAAEKIEYEEGLRNFALDVIKLAEEDPETVKFLMERAKAVKEVA
jgi:site-specific recombinase XerD/ribosomal protein L37E